MKTYYKNVTTLAGIVKQAIPKPTFELSEEQIEKLRTFSDALLSILTVAGTLTLTIAAPNALRIFDLFEKKRKSWTKKPSRAWKQKKILRTFYYLRQQGKIEFKKKGNDYEVILTEKGRKKLKKINFQTMTGPREKTWDGKFWQVAADIPTKYRIGADAFRDKLKSMNFYPLQRTLWFYPYDPRVEIEFIARTYGISSFVTMMKIQELDPSDERLLKVYFKELDVV